MPVQIDTDGAQRLLGRTITSVMRNPPSGEPYELDSETLFLTLDDGSEWKFVGEGYDASGLVITAIWPDEIE